jgi:hypothetical protein
VLAGAHTFSAFIHQFFFFGTGDFVSDFCLAKYAEEDISEIWLSAEEKSYVSSFSVGQGLYTSVL